MINKNQLQEIIKDLIEVCENLDIKGIPTSIIFSESCSYHRGMIAGEQRKINYAENKTDNPTEKQIFALKLLKKYKPGITKQEAFRIIKESKK